MNIPQAKALLGRFIEAGMQVLLVGAPGIGKTDIVRAIAQKLGYRLIISHPVVSDPTDFKGLPFAVDVDGETQARFLPIGQLVDLIEAEERTLWFLDDLGQAPPSVQAALMQLVHRRGRSLGQHRLSDAVRVVAATNRVDDGAMVRGLLSPLRSRFQLILELDASLEAWIPYALEKGLDPRIIAFLKYQVSLGRERFLVPDADPTAIVQTCCPRSWTEAVGPLLELDRSTPFDRHTRRELLCAAIGQEVAIEFDAFLEAAEKLVSLKEILSCPDTAPVPPPSALDVRYMTITGLALHLIRTEDGPTKIEAAARYVRRFPGELRELFRHTIAATQSTDLLETRAMVELTADSLKLAAA